MVAPADKWLGPNGMPHICFTRGEDDGSTPPRCAGRRHLYYLVGV